MVSLCLETRLAERTLTQVDNLSVLAALVCVLFDAYVGALYCTKLIRNEISPRFATWLIL